MAKRKFKKDKLMPSSPDFIDEFHKTSTGARDLIYGRTRENNGGHPNGGPAHGGVSGLKEARTQLTNEGALAVTNSGYVYAATQSTEEQPAGSATEPTKA
jgi:hypothetical protein